VLDVGSKDAPYRRFVRSTSYLTLDVVPSLGADIVGDIHDIPRPDGSFDIVIATEVLEHCRDPQLAVDEIRRVLRNGGICVLSTRFLYPYHPAPSDYFRFTDEGLAHLFRAFSTVEIRPLGGRVVSAWMLMPRRGRILGSLCRVLDPIVARADPVRTKAACGYLVRGLV
jgi:SAM-dependent methyltransferase